MKPVALLRSGLKALMSVLFPEKCVVCGRTLVSGEHLICLHCNVAMPRTRYHLSRFNHMHERLMGDAHVERAASWFHYKRKSPYTNIILQAKYYDRPRVAADAAAMFAAEIQPDGFFDGIDIILPVPMHPFKELRRGYNQAEMLAHGLSRVTGLPVGDNLRARHGHRSQTRRGAYDRYVNVAGLFDVADTDELAGKHLLIVDDVMTTGSTVLACCEAVRRSVPDATISVLTLASATLD